MNRFFIILFCSCLMLSEAVAQKNVGPKGFSIYKKYDQSFITPDLKRKHAVSFGPAFTTYTPKLIDLVISPGVQLGYNYLILNRRRIKMSRKLRFREELKFGFGVYFNLYTESQFSLMANFYRPFLRTKGRFLNWFFLSSYGFGVLKSIATEENTNPIALNLDIELIRLRIGKLPMYLHFNFDYAIKNDLLAKDRLNLGFSAGLRYYIFKNKP